MSKFLSIINDTTDLVGERTGSDLKAIGEAIIALSQLRASGQDHNMKWVSDLDTLPDNWSAEAKGHADMICNSMAIEQIDDPKTRFGPGDCAAVKQQIKIHYVFEEEGTKVIPIAPASSFAKGLANPPMEVPNFYVDDFLSNLIVQREEELVSALQNSALNLNEDTARAILVTIKDTLNFAADNVEDLDLFHRQLGAYSISQCR